MTDSLKDKFILTDIMGHKARIIVSPCKFNRGSKNNFLVKMFHLISCSKKLMNARASALCLLIKIP